MSHRAGNGWNWTLLGLETVHSTQICISRDVHGHLDHFSWALISLRCSVDQFCLDLFSSKFNRAWKLNEFEEIGTYHEFEWIIWWQAVPSMQLSLVGGSSLNFFWLLCRLLKLWMNYQAVPSMQLSLNTVGAMKDQVRPDQLQLLPLGRAHVARHNDAALQTVPGGWGGFIRQGENTC